MTTRWSVVVSALIGCSLLSGCHQGEELRALEQEVGEADMLLAEEQDQGQHLVERRVEAEQLLALREKECPPTRLNESGGRLEALVSPAKVSPHAGTGFTLSGSGGLPEMQAVLTRLGAEAGDLSVRQLAVANLAWVARVEVWSLCQPLPPLKYTEFAIPPKTDWLRLAPDELRERLARDQRWIHDLERVIGPEVRRLNWLRKYREAELHQSRMSERLAGQVELVTALLATAQPRRLRLLFDREPVQIEADRPLAAAAETAGGWEVHAGGRCDANWCATAAVFPAARRGQPAAELLGRP